MRRLSFLLFLLAFALAGCAHSGVITATSRTIDAGPESIPAVAQSESISTSPVVYAASVKDEEDIDNKDDPSSSEPELSGQGSEENGDESDNNEEEEAGPKEGEGKKAVTIADPLEKFNRAMFTFNDRLYYWVLKPVAQGYQKVVPEKPRVSVSNFFKNAVFPIRFVSFLFQGDFSGATADLGRFLVNTIWGIGGLLDPASTKQLEIPKKDADLGQMLGYYGVGQGFYIVWPFLGPSSARDTADIVGGYFLNPVTAFIAWYEGIGVRTYETVNDTSLRIGDYESLMEAAIDPYIALRDAYAQYRQNKVESVGKKAEPPKPGGVTVGQLGVPEFRVVQSLDIGENENAHKQN